MQPIVRAGQRRRQRPVRVVKLGAQCRMPTNQTQVTGWLVGLEALRQLSESFPEEFAAHVAHRTVTAPMLLRSAEALLGWANKIVQLDDSRDLHIPGDPVAWLDRPFDERWEHAALEMLEQSRYQLDGVTVIPCGIGVYAVCDGEKDPPSLLTGALWWMCGRTSYSTGINMAEFIEVAYPKAVHLLEDLAEVPYNVDMALLARHFRYPDFEPASGTTMGTILRYAFAQTDNFYANTHWFELEYMNDGDLPRWEDLYSLPDELAEARLIECEYERWEAMVLADPARHLPVVECALHAAAKAAFEAAAAAQETDDGLTPEQIIAALAALAPPVAS